MNMTLMTLLASHMNHWDHSWWPIWPLLWIGLIVTVVWLFRRRHWTAARPQTGAERARDILAERYARGEITNDEYRERLEHLR
jgi:putative membrane protein